MLLLPLGRFRHSCNCWRTFLALLILVVSSQNGVKARRVLPSEKAAAQAQNDVFARRLSQELDSQNGFVDYAWEEEREALIDVDVDIPEKPNGHLVKSLPLLDEGVFPTKHWAGHLPASDDGLKYFFYWLFEPDLSGQPPTDVNQTTLDDAPLVVWINGGPACSSMDGLFIENGPFRLVMNSDKSYNIQPAEYSWHKLPAYTLYIDQPVGTGLSFTTNQTYPTNDTELADDFTFFLQEFLTLHSDKFVSTVDNIKTVNRPFFFSGESYAGHYLPSFSARILENNDNLQKDQIAIPISGIAIGNGWTWPYYQYSGSLAAYGLGYVDFTQMASLDQKETLCQMFIDIGDYAAEVCFGLIDSILTQSQGMDTEHRINGYNMRESIVKGSKAFPPGHKAVESYLGGYKLADEPGNIPPDVAPAVLKAIHASAATDAGQKYLECTDPPYYALAWQDGKGVEEEVVQVLEHKSNVRLLFFNGVLDLICNHVGNERFLANLDWKRRNAYLKAERYAWVADSEDEGEISGWMKDFENLQFLKLRDCGHMVPLDRPSIAFDMMKTFVFGGDFTSSRQRLSQRFVAECEVCEECRGHLLSCPSGRWVVLAYFFTLVAVTASVCLYYKSGSSLYVGGEERALGVEMQQHRSLMHEDEDDTTFT